MAEQVINRNRGLMIALKSSDVQFALAVVCIIMMMFIPLPPLLLDILLSVSITLSFLVLLVSIYVDSALEFSAFPTFLLLSTLFRLALNIATTRNILLDGSTGHVSQVVSAFGNFVVGGNYFVGFVIFLILIIVNFMVITKGAGRVAEVGARFTLDAMPGKQMSIDADLNAGVIDRDEARKRRQKIEEEADFYGSMDGASKFVRGDAIAGPIITAINIIVGLFVGVLQHDMNFSDAARVYTILTVGDGLVSQIPSIIISVAAGIVVTRASGNGHALSDQISHQIFLYPKALFLSSGLLALMGLMPGVPTISLFALAGIFALIGRYSMNRAKKIAQEKTVVESQKKETKSKESIEAILQVDTLALEVGVSIIPLVDTAQDGEILERIVSARKQFAQDIGIIVPMVMVRDNIQLRPSDYQILLKGQVVASGSLLVDHELAMAPDSSSEPIEGILTKEPAYGLDAVWIKPSQKGEASFRGYTVVNCATVVVTHLTKVISEYAPELIGRQEVQQLADTVKEKSPKVYEEVFNTEGLTLGDVVKVLQNLLREGVSIRDLLSIFEALADHCKHTKNPEVLTKNVRKKIGRSIARKYLHQDNLYVVSLDKATEDVVLSALERFDDGSTSLKLDPEIAQKLLNNIAEGLKEFDSIGSVPVIMCGPSIRFDLHKLIEHFIPGVFVISYDEIPKGIKIKTIKIIHL